MTKIVLDDVAATGYRSAQKINSNNDTLVAAVENTLSRDGTAPNYMEAVLDMNSNRVINVGEPLASTDAIRLQDLMDAAGTGLTVNVVEAGAIDWPNVTNKPTTFEPTTESVQDIVGSTLVAGSNVTLTYNDGAGTLTIASSGGGGGATIVDVITNGDTTNAPTGNAVFDALALKLDATAVTTSVTNGDTTHVPTADAVYDAIAASGGGATVINSIADADTTNAPSRNAVYDALVLKSDRYQDPYPNFKYYGAAVDGATDDVAAMTAYQSDTTAKLNYIGGTTFLSGSATGRSISKPSHGPGNIKLTASSSWLPADFAWITSQPTLGTGTDIDYFFSSDLSKIRAKYRILGAGNINVRKSPTQVYYEANTTPEFEVLANWSGWSGATSTLNGAISAGATSATLNSVAGITTGDVMGFINPSTGAVENVKTVTVSGSSITWTGGLPGGYADKTVVTHGTRTMNPYRHTRVTAFGGGDTYANLAIGVMGYTPLAGQVHFFQTATVGLYGGEIAFNTSGTYATSEEYNISDLGFDVAAIGRVHSFQRTNDTGARSVVWIGDLLKSEGSVAIDAFQSYAGKSRVGIDMARADFSSNGQAAIQLALGHAIYFNSSTTVGGRGYGQSAYGFGPLYGNTYGSIRLYSGNDGISDFLTMEHVGAGRLRVRPTAVQSNVDMSINGYLNISGDMNLGSTGHLQFGFGSSEYLHKVGTALYWYNGTTDTYIAG